MNPSNKLHLNRREFLQNSAALLLTAALFAPKKAWPFENTEPELDPPDFSQNNILRILAGIRPYRKSGVRIERQDLKNKMIIHHYGHGGAGYTLSWGSAEIAVDLFEQSRHPHALPVAVVGAGVIGLSTAWVLRERGYSVRVYAKNFSPHTTSDLAGAQWSPSAVTRGDTELEQRRFDDMLTRAYRRFASLEGSEYGIFRRANYVAGDWGGPLDHIPAGLIPPCQRLIRLPFRGTSHPGRLYQSFLIEPPIYLPKIWNTLREQGVTFEKRSFASLEELSTLEESAIFHCTGLGAKSIALDEAMLPIRGHLVHLRPKPLPYLLLHEGYVFPRHDAVVLGGTFEKGIADPTPDPVMAARVLEMNRRFFHL